jgi:hypothetical protein
MTSAIASSGAAFRAPHGPWERPADDDSVCRQEENQTVARENMAKYYGQKDASAGL